MSQALVNFLINNIQRLDQESFKLFVESIIPVCKERGLTFEEIDDIQERFHAKIDELNDHGFYKLLKKYGLSSTREFLLSFKSIDDTKSFTHSPAKMSSIINFANAVLTAKYPFEKGELSLEDLLKVFKDCEYCTEEKCYNTFIFFNKLLAEDNPKKIEFEIYRTKDFLKIADFIVKFEILTQDELKIENGFFTFWPVRPKTLNNNTVECPISKNEYVDGKLEEHFLKFLDSSVEGKENCYSALCKEINLLYFKYREKITIKHCADCGIWFIRKSKNKQYCDKCSSGLSRTRRYRNPR